MNADSPGRFDLSTAAESEQVVLHAAQLAATELPLHEGLFAASREVGSRRLSRALVRLGNAIQRGAPFRSALEECRSLVPPHLAAALAAAEKSGQLGPVLAEWTENQLASQARSRQLTQALAYPAICVILSVGLVAFIGWCVVPAFDQMFREFELPITSHTRIVLWLGKIAFPVIAIGTASAAALLVLLRLLGGRVLWCRVRNQVPLLGKLWHWSGAAEAFRMLAILLEHHTPLGEALRLAGHGASDAFAGQAVADLAAEVEAGGSLSDNLLRDGRLPQSLAPLLRAGERSGQLARFMREGAIMLEQRSVARCDLVAAVVPPLLFLVIGVAISTALMAISLPLLNLLDGLSR